MTLKVLDLYSGLDGWGAAFRARGHHVVSLDWEPKFGADFQMDILKLDGLDSMRLFSPEASEYNATPKQVAKKIETFVANRQKASKDKQEEKS